MKKAKLFKYISSFLKDCLECFSIYLHVMSTRENHYQLPKPSKNAIMYERTQ